MKEWYLLTSETRPNATGGFENENFLNYKEDAFAEALQTDIGTTVTLYNYDLSESTDIRCIISGNVSNTSLSSLQREVLVPIGTIKSGMYIFFNGGYWLTTGMPGNNGIYEKIIAVWCQYHLRWQNENGDIIERWVNGTSASKYDVGEVGSKYMILLTNNFTLLMPNDTESQLLDEKRVFIDIKDKNPTKVYKVTRDDDILYDHGVNGGTLSFIVNRTEFNPATDNQELKIADYFTPTPTQPEVPDENGMTTSIVGRTDIVIGKSRTYTIQFKNEDDEELSGVTYSTNIVSDLGDKVTYVEYPESQAIVISVANDDALINSSITLQVIVDGQVVCETTINITGLF